MTPDDVAYLKYDLEYMRMILSSNLYEISKRREQEKEEGVKDKYRQKNRKEKISK